MPGIGRILCADRLLVSGYLRCLVIPGRCISLLLAVTLSLRITLVLRISLGRIVSLLNLIPLIRNGVRISICGVSVLLWIANVRGCVLFVAFHILFLSEDSDNDKK